MSDSIRTLIDLIMKTNLSERLQQAMTAKGFSQGGLAKASGVAQPTIWRLANGHAKGTTKLLDIAHALGVSVDWLANGVGAMEADDQANAAPSARLDMRLGGAFFVPIYDKNEDETDLSICVPESVKSDTCRAYVLERNSGCYEAPAGTTIVVDTAERPGNGDFIYARVAGTVSVYKFVEGGATGYLSVDDERVPLMPVSPDVEIIGVVVFLLRDLKRKK